MTNYNARVRRGKKTKYIINRFDNNRPRLVVFRSNKNVVAQVVTPGENGDVVHAYCSSVDKSLRSKMKGNKVEQASIIGETVAKIALKAGIKEVAFDRSGYKYHGRVKAIAEAARNAGLNF